MPLVRDKTPIQIKTMIGLRDVAEHFGVTTRCIQKWIDEGVFPQPIRIGRRLLRWEIGRLNDWISAGCPRPRQEQQQ